MLDARDLAARALSDVVEPAPDEEADVGLLDGVDDALAVGDLLGERHGRPEVGHGEDDVGASKRAVEVGGVADVALDDRDALLLERLGRGLGRVARDGAELVGLVRAYQVLDDGAALARRRWRAGEVSVMTRGASPVRAGRPGKGRRGAESYAPERRWHR